MFKVFFSLHIFHPNHLSLQVTQPPLIRGESFVHLQVGEYAIGIRLGPGWFFSMAKGVTETLFDGWTKKTTTLPHHTIRLMGELTGL